MESEPGPADERAAGDDRGPVGPAGKAADVDRPRDQAPAFDGPTDPDRRAFFRSLSRDALRAAVRVAPAGLAGGSSDWLAALAGTEADRRSGTPIGAGRGSALAGAPGEPAITPAGIGYRSPYRIEDGTLLVLDQLRFPEVIAEVACEDASDVARLMREERVRGPVLAQVAAYGLWLAAERRRALPPPDRLAALRTAAEALRAGRPTMPAVAAALERLLDAAARTADASGAVAADAIRLAADSVASDALTGHLAIGRAGTDLLARPGDRPLAVLTIDDTGPLSGGTVGTAMGVVQTLAAEGRPVEVWQAETEPSRAGARLGAWELALADVPATVVPDATTGALLAAGRVDVVLVGADAVAVDGSLLNAAGTYPMALAAARAGVPFYACFPRTQLDPRAASGADFRPRTRPSAAGAEIPVQDVTPPDLVTGWLTEAGLERPPFGLHRRAEAA